MNHSLMYSARSRPPGRRQINAGSLYDQYTWRSDASAFEIAFAECRKSRHLLRHAITPKDSQIGGEIDWSHLMQSGATSEGMLHEQRMCNKIELKAGLGHQL